MSKISTTNNKYTSIIIMSIVMMVSLIIIPFSTGWFDGVIPEFDDLGHGLFDVFRELVEDGKDAWRSVIVRGTLFAAVCDVILFLSSVCKSKIMSVLSTLGGIITMAWSMFMYIDLNDFDAVFDFDNCGTTIGFWIPFVLFIICFISAVRIPSKSSDLSMDSQSELNTNNEMEGK